jgi:hypothetical protein
VKERKKMREKPFLHTRLYMFRVCDWLWEVTHGTIPGSAARPAVSSLWRSCLSRGPFPRENEKLSLSTYGSLPPPTSPYILHIHALWVTSPPLNRTLTLKLCT